MYRTKASWSLQCSWWLITALAAWLPCVQSLSTDFMVTTPGDEFAYDINGMDGNPTITLIRGKTYTFDLNTSLDHPFAIGTAVAAGSPPGVSGDNGSSTGTITFAVPTNAVDCVYYCVIHLFSGDIHMIDPPAPPPVRIVGLTVGTNITLITSQATTNGFAFLPEANTNLGTTNWFALTVQGSRFANGTNEIICGKPPATNVFLRIRIQ
jgi:hypothetical protein